MRLLIESNAEARRHYQSREAAVVIPLFQALITGAASAVVIGVVIGGFLIWMDRPAVIPALLAAGVSFPVVALLSWMNRMNDWRRLIWHLETAFRVDIDQDEEIGDPEPEERTATVRVEVVDRETGRQVWCELPNADKLPAFFRGVLTGRGLAETTWGGKGKLFSLPEYRAFRETLLRRGWIEYVDPDAPLLGYRLTRAGEAVARHFASKYDSSPPPA